MPAISYQYLMSLYDNLEYFNEAIAYLTTAQFPWQFNFAFIKDWVIVWVHG